MFDVTLSFDNGPDPQATPEVLDCLARRGVLASFFVVGRRLHVREQRRLAERAHAEGHFIGNHSFTHSIPLGERDEPDLPALEIEAAQQLMAELCHANKWFRPFGGGGRLDQCLLNRRCAEHLIRERYSCVLWNVVPRDWEDPDGWVERALAQCEAQPHSLVVLHDLPTGAMRHLDRFVGELQTRGASLQQHFPASCVPILRGQLTQPIDRYVAA
ncbi:MAG: polysaccharide deacetylase family protein [Polyangiales bacterium]